jgi:restriction system protein
MGTEKNEPPSVPPEKNEPPSVPADARPWAKSPEHEVTPTNPAVVLGMMNSSSRFAAGNFVAQLVREKSGLLLQAVINTGDKTSEGRLVESVTAIWFDIMDLLQKDPSIAFQISWEKWEHIIAGAYQKSGFFDEVILTQRSGDYGKDVIAIKRGFGSVRVIDQVKAFGPGHRVTANDVRAMIGVLQTDGAAKGFVTTTSDFAPRIERDPRFFH